MKRLSYLFLAVALTCGSLLVASQTFAAVTQTNAATVRVTATGAKGDTGPAGSGGGAAASTELTDFSATAASNNGQIPIWDNGQRKYIPGDPLVQGLYAPGSTTEANPVLIGGWDGGALRAMKIDSAGNVYAIISGSISNTGFNVNNFPATQPVSIATMPSTPVTGAFWQATQPISAVSLPLPTNAATTTDVQAVRDRLPAALDADGGGKVHVQNFPATQPVSAASLPLPTGAAQDSTISTMSGKLPTALGTKTIANSMAVTVASDQTVPVSAASLPLPTGAAQDSTISTMSGKLPAALDGSGYLKTHEQGTANVTGTFWQATQPVSGTFYQATQPVSIASMPSTPVTGTFWQATQPVSGTFYQATQPVSIASMPSTPVTGTFYQATQPVSIATAPVLVAGSAVIGKVGIDQTTPGTTNGVQVNAAIPAGSNVIGSVKIVGSSNDQMKVTATGYPTVSVESLEFFDTIDGAAVNTNLWTQTTSTMTITQSGGFINLNPTNSTATSVYAILSSVQQFFLTSCIPLHIHLDMQSSLWNVPANTTIEAGWMTATTTSAPTDGVLIRASSGTTSLIANYGGVETATAFTLPAANATSEYVLDIYADSARLFIDGTLVATVNRLSTQPALTANNRQPVTFRVYNGGSAPGSSGTLKLGQISIQQRNAALNKPMNYRMAGMARSLVQSPSAFTQIANWTNSTEPASASLSNTAAGYTTLGGQYAFAAPAGAATDYALFAFQVPAGYQFYITDVAITAMNGSLNGGAAGATVATTPTVVQWGIAVNSSAVSLATADGAGTWAPRRMTLGTHGFAVGNVVGTVGADIVRSWQTPLVADGGRYIHVFARVPTGTATTNQIIRGTVQINGYAE